MTIPAFRSASWWRGPDPTSRLESEHPDVSGFFLANGFSGHELMMAPATGRAVAELITNATSRTIDVSVFAFDRFRTGALLPTDATI